jgi:Rrf2 family protein
MPLVSRKGILAIAAVIDVAIHSRTRPVSAKALASRHQLPPRHLEPVLQTLVRDGILKGIRGPRGGYEIGRDQAQITADDILKSASRIEEAEQPLPESPLVGAVVQPALAAAERSFSAALREITVAEMARQALNSTVHGLDSFDTIPVAAKVR